MSVVGQFIAERQAQKLKSARTLSEAALRKIQDSLVESGTDAIRPLTECLGHGDARPVALQVLGQLLDDATLEHFSRALASPNPAIVSGVCRILSTNHNYHPSKLLPLLLQKEVSRSALEGILTEQLLQLPVDVLLSTLPEAPRDAQIILFRLLEKAPGGGEARAVLDLMKHADAWVRTNATRLAALARNPDARRGMEALLNDVNKNVRLEAVQGLQALEARGSVPEIVKLLHDPDLKIQSAAIDALCSLADASAVPLLLEVLTDETDTVRRAAVEVLNEVATTDAVQDLVRALRDQDWWVRVRAADALGTLGGEVVVQAVAGLLQDPDDFIRRHAVEILNSVPSKGAVEALVLAIEDRDWWVRERAIDALGKSRDPRAAAPLLLQMDRGGSTQTLCIKALAALGHPDALHPLMELLNSDRPEVRREAGEALKAFPRDALSSEDRGRLHELLGSTHLGAASSLGVPMRSQERAGSPAPLPRAPRAGRPGRPSEPVSTAQGSEGQSPQSAPHAAGAGSRQLNFADLPVETVLLGRYRVLRKVGRGGFGAVYLVEDSVIQEDVILKILNPQLSLDESSARRFVQELKLTRRITHPNVIRIYDFLHLEGSHAVSMEYFPGRDLGQVLAEERTLDYKRGLQVLAQVCDGLEAAHAVGVVHRDVKPPNILIGTGDKVKVVDFGLASIQQQIGSRLTKSGLLIGTPEYMAPEQITGDPVDHRADIYSVGILLYEIFSGSKPFTAETPVKVLFQHLEGKPEPLRDRVNDIPAGIEELAASCMAKDPAQRPGSAAALRNRIEEELRALVAAA